MVGTAHMLKTKPIALWVINALFIVAVSGNHDYSDSRVGERKIAALILQCNPNTSLVQSIMSSTTIQLYSLTPLPSNSFNPKVCSVVWVPAVQVS